LWMLAVLCLGALVALAVVPLCAGARADEPKADGTELTAGAQGEGNEGEEGPAAFGDSVALSADGGTALVGAPFDAEGRGAAWVFVYGEGHWTQVAKLTGGQEETGPGRFGRAVALSADGATALVGAPGDRAGGGSVWLFQLSGGRWSRMARLTPGQEQGVGHFGRGLALSGDGDTALVGAPGEGAGKVGGAWVFTRSGSTWTSGERLIDAEEDGEARFGRAVALSADGASAVIGGSTDDGGAGAAWTFARTGTGAGSWAQQAGKLNGGAEEVGGGQFGTAVALSPDGLTALVAAPRDGEGLGAVWAYTRADSHWSQLGGKLVSGIGPRGQNFGSSVALSGNGGTALIGEARAQGRAEVRPGGAWMFGRAGSSWSSLGFFVAKETDEQPGEQFGRGAALSSDGRTSLVGALGSETEINEGKVGAVWAFMGLPVLKEPPIETSEAPPGEKGETAGREERAGGEEASDEKGRTGQGTHQAPAGAFPSSDAQLSPGGQVLAVHSGGCGVRLASTHVSVDGQGRAAVRLHGGGSGRCRGSVALSVLRRAPATGARRAKTRRLTIAAGGFALIAGRTGTLRLKLTSTGRALLLNGHGRLAVSLRLVRTLPAPMQALTATAHLVAQRPRKSVRR
ncbi:MAG TPA: FG-GAP repeat protein, partial [Solirubrobacteraceae bacterium]|nr:FG-GAP repeat protein [Solirubrobacteraceae bacterium]